MAEGKLTSKVFVCGVDAMDPRLTRKYIDMGLMPNAKKMLEKGAAREDLVMLGGHPTVTPPMWTTLACGCYANVHGITGFYRCGDDIDLYDYNLDSRNCHAEPLWNVFAEAGKKTLVWHWPGSAWPPTSDNPNLLVVDGTSPGSVGMATSQVEGEFIVGANVEIPELVYIPKAPMEASAACVITDLDIEEGDKDAYDMSAGISSLQSVKGSRKLLTSLKQHTTASTESPVDVVRSPIKEAAGWAAAPADAKEFTILFSKGQLRRPALILKNEKGIYDRVALYKNKKATEPIVVCPVGEMVVEVIDESIKNDKTYKVNRNMKLLKLDEEGKSLNMYISCAMDITNDSVWSPKRLYQEVTETCGYPRATGIVGTGDAKILDKCLWASWDSVCQWQSDALNHLIETEDYDAIFSHYHNVDGQAHQIMKFLKERPESKMSAEKAMELLENVYEQTDEYIGQYLDMLDDGWTIMIVSDHGQICGPYEPPLLGDSGGVDVGVMRELGYTEVLKDENGNDTYQIDWSKTRAISKMANNIFINLKGRSPQGIVDPVDQYELEEQIITDLYSYKYPQTGKRVVALALRKKDAAILGMGGEDCGDIVFMLAEGYNFDHVDSLSTTLGIYDTSVSPIFVAAGPGIKHCVTNRVIREIDIAPTIAELFDIRKPADCEGAPIYQILDYKQ